MEQLRNDVICVYIGVRYVWAGKAVPVTPDRCIMNIEDPCTMKKSYKLEPPDGGYGYVVLAAATIIFAALGMFFVCFTMMFNDVFIMLQMDSTDISVVTGVYALGVAVSGWITGPLLKVMTRRKLAFVGAVFLNAGYYGTVFINTKTQFIICQGLLKSIGTGFLYNISCSALNDYFLEKRLFAMSFALSAAAIGTMFAPMLVTACIDRFGFHSMLVIVTGITMQTFVAAALLQPVAWHMRKVELADDVPENKLLQNDTSFEESKIKQAQVTDDEKANNLSNEDKKDHKTLTKNRVISRFKNFLDWPLMKRYFLTCCCLGPPIAMFADYTFINFLAQALYDLDWSKDQVKWAYSMLGFGDIAARFLIILMSTWLRKISSYLIYIIGLFISIVSRLAFAWVKDYTSALATISLMGVSRCTVMMLFPVVVSDSVKSEEYPSAMGICMLIFGLLCITIGPIIGTIRDATGSYRIVFAIVIGIMVVVTIIWGIQLLRSWRRWKPLSVPEAMRNRALSISYA